MNLFSGRVHEWIDAGAFEVIDAFAARELFERAGAMSAPDHAWLLACLTLRAYRDGHSRLNLDAKSLASWRPENVGDWVDDPAAAHEIFAAVPLVFGDETTTDRFPRTPFVESNGGLYVAGVLHEEKWVAEWLRAGNGARIRIVLGGPGTGKTYTIAERLRTHPSPVPSVALCAPTGKASRHMKEVLDGQLRKEGAGAEVLSVIERAPSDTVHKLLGSNPRGSSRYRYDTENRLDQKLVIVDEASMMSLSLMYNLLRAVPDDGEVWLVGDPDQLASVDAGSVLADIRMAAAPRSNFLFPRTTVLDEQRRFAPDSGIAALAAAVREREVDKVRSILDSGAADVDWVDLAAHRSAMRSLTDLVVAHARSVVDAATAGDVSTALALKSELQVLSATRVGRSGVDGWNELIERRLGPATSSRTYLGRPVMVTRNDTVTDLSNGDVGVICRSGNEDRAFFGDPASPFEVPMARLPETATVHALTIHKSQGSEYDHAVVVIPSGDNRVVTRELLYTGITRPRTKLTLVASWESIEKAILRDARRATGLEQRLTAGGSV